MSCRQRSIWASFVWPLTVIGVLIAIPLQQGHADERPNIVLIIADDMNWNDNSVYGHPTIQTPNLQRLADAGLRFDHAYLTASSCSPSRSSLITGRYPHNTGAEQLHWPLPPRTETFVKRLRDAGYYTAAAGKWHLGDAVKRHFDRIEEASVAGFQLPSGGDGQAPKMVAKKPSGCEDWLPVLKQRPKDQPFFLWLAALDPHRAYEAGAFEPPHQISDVRVPPHLPDTPEVREDLRLYYDEIARLDRYLGSVLDELDRQGVAKNTLVLFISDNGRPFPRDKTTLYNGGIKTPCIARWPDVIAANTETRSLVSSVDIAQTCLEVAGIPDQEFGDGKSFAPVFKNPSIETRQYAFAEDHWHDYEDQGRAVIDQRYKLIRNDYPDLPGTPPADAGRSPTWTVMRALEEKGQLTKLQRACFVAPRRQWELYDLEDDPGETKNLAGSPRLVAVQNRLEDALQDWAKTTGDFLPSRRTPDEFDRVTGEPDHSVRRRPRPSKLEMYGTWGRY